jgi:hypothetical protein
MGVTFDIVICHGSASGFEVNYLIPLCLGPTKAVITGMMALCPQ